MYYVYILKSIPFGKYYIGQTENMGSRLAKHNSGSVHSTKPYIPYQIILTIEKNTRTEALILERKLKNLNRTDLEKFIAKYSHLAS